MLTNTKVKNHECHICKNKFSQKSSLVTHFRGRLGEKPYGCVEYGKWFTQASYRNRNLQTYHKELRKKQQLKLKCKLPKTIVYNYLKTIDEYNAK